MSKYKRAPNLDLSHISMQDVELVAARAQKSFKLVRDSVLRPEDRKKSPRFSQARLAELCGLARQQFTYRFQQEDLPRGLKLEGRNRDFSLEEARTWVKAVGNRTSRQPNERACRLTVTNFKGGVGKTSTAVSIAQGLTLHGLKVLLIDMDPQGSATTLAGMNSALDVKTDETLSALFFGDTKTLESLVQPTYWDGLSVIPANIDLYGAEFALAAKQSQSGFQFFNVLNEGLKSIDRDFDVICIDTPPSLGFTTFNALHAADVLVLPTIPEMLDFASLSQFWNLFSEIGASLDKLTGSDKEWYGIHMFLSKMEESSSTAPVVRKWMADTYRGMMLPVEIPKSAVVASSAAGFSTVYDLTRYHGDSRTFLRARQAYDRLVELLIPSIEKTWTKSAASAALGKLN